MNNGGPVIISTVNALIEALKTEKPLQKVLISKSKRDYRIDLIKKLCRERGIIYQFVVQDAIDRKAGSGNQGVFAEAAPVDFVELSSVLEDLHSGFVLILDGITDTGNMGALLRTAAAVEADAVVLTSRHSAPVNETVLRTSAGALFNTRLVMASNLKREIKKLKDAGFWILGAQAGARTVYTEYDYSAPFALVLGSESRGLSPALKKELDLLVSIPISSKIESLNVSVAAGVILFEACRQKAVKN